MDIHSKCVLILVKLHMAIVFLSILGHFYPETCPTVLCISPAIFITLIVIYGLLRGIIDLLRKC